jgi:hypothetical protein
MGKQPDLRGFHNVVRQKLRGKKHVLAKKAQQL